MWNTVLFDLDGTLTDSGEGITKSVQYALQKGFDIAAPDLNELQQFVGPPLKEQFMEYASLTEEQALHAVELYRERYSVRGIYENRLYQGITELLKELKHEGFRIALSSSKPEIYCRQILNTFGISKYFDAIVGSELDGTRIDKSEVVEEALRRLGSDVRREQTVLIGDRSYDAVGAKTSRISCIGVTYGFGSRNELEQEWPECIVDSVSELRNVLIGQYRDGMQEKCKEKQNEIPSYQELNAASKKLYPYDGSVGYRIFRLLSPLFLGLVISTIAAYLGNIIALIRNGFQPDTTVTMDMLILMTGVMDVAIFIVMYFTWKRDEQQRIEFGANERQLKKNSFGVKEVIVLIGAVETVAVLASWASAFLTPISESYGALMESISQIPPWLSFVLVAFVAPIAEELLFRGVVYRRARDYYNVYVAALISAVLFGIYHGNLSQGISATVVGFFLCLVYEHYGTLKASVLCHMTINFFGTIGILNRSAVVASILGMIVFSIAMVGIFCIWLIFKKEPKVNQI